MNVIARLEYELAYYDSAVHRFNHYTTRTPPSFSECAHLAHEEYTCLNKNQIRGLVSPSLDSNSILENWSHTILFERQMTLATSYFIPRSERHLWHFDWTPSIDFSFYLNSLTLYRYKIIVPKYYTKDSTDPPQPITSVSLLIVFHVPRLKPMWFACHSIIFNSTIFLPMPRQIWCNNSRRIVLYNNRAI